MRTTRLLSLATAAMLVLTLSATASASVSHTVRRGETLSSVAATDGLSIARLAAANGLAPTAQLIVGQSLVIPPRGGALIPATTVTSAASTRSAQATEGGSGSYLVRPGDTLSAIALRFGTTPAALAAANGLSVNGLLLAGATLTISGTATSTAAAPATTESTSGATPTDETISPSEVGEIAASDGVPAALAEAIADQESGFNNAEVSSTGAIGVMQIEPGTWRDLERIDGLDLSRDSVIDNVRGGVAVLRGLLAATGGDSAEAVAAYYQGLRSVREHGMYPSTRRYVADVLALESRFGG